MGWHEACAGNKINAYKNLRQKTLGDLDILRQAVNEMG
jgi:hypothetical protein